MHYQSKQLLDKPLGNNAFAWKERTAKYGRSPSLVIPSTIDGTLDDVQIGSDIVFEEIEDGELRSCVGLEHFVRIQDLIVSDAPLSFCEFGVSVSEDFHEKFQTVGPRGTVTRGSFGNLENQAGNRYQNEVEESKTFGTFSHKSTEIGLQEEGQILRASEGQLPEIIVFDNHNHALYYWIDAMRQGIIQPGCELIHIDEHSDLWSNDHILDLEKAIKDETYAWEYTNLKCNVGNYILPAINSGLIGNMIRIENEYQINEHMGYIPSKNSILNLDLDIFAPELDHIPSEKKIKVIKNLLKQVKYVTIATSPFFIEQGLAIRYLNQILEIKEKN